MNLVYYISMIIREKWLKKIRPFYESELVKVIIGIRRCGKSVVSEFLFFKPFFYVPVSSAK